MLGYLALVPIGLLVGYFVGIVGIGAGVILMPMLLAYGFTLTQAVAAGLFLQVVPQSLPGLWVYWKHGEVRMWECIVLAVASALGMLGGAWMANKGWLSKRTLYWILFTLMALSTAYVFCRYLWLGIGDVGVV